jgi:hypothetical protein
LPPSPESFTSRFSSARANFATLFPCCCGLRALTTNGQFRISASHHLSISSCRLFVVPISVHTINYLLHTFHRIKRRRILSFIQHSTLFPQIYATMKFIAPFLALVAAALAQNNAINIPAGGLQVTAGQPFTITWSDPSSSTVTIKLQQGSGVTPSTGITLLSRSLTFQCERSS